jgi:hypothetical protein
MSMNSNVHMAAFCESAVCGILDRRRYPLSVIPLLGTA